MSSLLRLLRPKRGLGAFSARRFLVSSRRLRTSAGMSTSNSLPCLVGWSPALTADAVDGAGGWPSTLAGAGAGGGEGGSRGRTAGGLGVLDAAMRLERRDSMYSVLGRLAGRWKGAVGARGQEGQRTCACRPGRRRGPSGA